VGEHQPCTSEGKPVQEELVVEIWEKGCGSQVGEKPQKIFLKGGCEGQGENNI
jgi:hypothetical protein